MLLTLLSSRFVFTRKKNLGSVAFCGNLLERWMAVKNPDNEHRGFDDWWSDKKLTKVPYGQINELYATAATTDRAIELDRVTRDTKLSWKIQITM